MTRRREFYINPMPSGRNQDGELVSTCLNKKPKQEFIEINGKLLPMYIHAIEYDAEREAAIEGLVEALERQTSPHVEQFCIERARKALERFRACEKDK